jgi:threonine dehydratase
MAPHVQEIASEIETGAPLGPSLAGGHPVEVSYRPSFADGIGTPFVNVEMFELAQRLGITAIGTSLEQTADAARILISRAAVTPEGAAATPMAAAMNGGAGTGKTVLVISGGNIDAATLQTILAGGIPE